MLGMFKKLIGKSTKEVEVAAVVSRLKKQTQKNSVEESSDFRNELDVLNHNRRAVLLSQELSSERDRWPKMRQTVAPAYTRGDGFWDRAVEAQKESLKNRNQILGSLQSY